MSDLLGISGNAAAAYQLALATVSNNIANVSTEGYSRQSVDLREAAPRQLGGAYIGTGVIYDRVKRQFDTFAELNLRNSTSQLASQEPMVDYTNRVVDLLGSEDAGLVSALDDFFSAARSLTTDPASTALRGSFFRAAQGLSARFALVSSQLDLVDTETRDALQGNVASINTLSQQLAAVNAQLAKQGSADRQPSELMDQRDRLLRELSQFVGIRASYATNGTVTVTLGSNSASKDVIVDGQRALRLGTTADASNPNRVGLTLNSPAGEPRAISSVGSGQLAGLLSFREQVIESTRNAVDDIAGVLVREINALHRSGVDGYGQPGGDLFKVEAGTSNLAAGIKVAIDDPLRIAAAAQFRVIENANNTGRADAIVSFEAPQPAGATALGSVLPNNPHPSAGKAFQLAGTPPLAIIGSIAAGLKDVVVYLNDARDDQQLQLITRDGRHLLGSALDQQIQTRDALLGSSGMQPGASYDSRYLGVSGADGYRDMQVFYGARADVQVQQAFDSADRSIGGERLPASLLGGRMRPGVSSIPAGALTLNGVSLPALTASSSTGLKATEVAAWLSAAGASKNITARAVNDVRAPVSQLKLDRALVLNGEAITPTGTGFGTPSGLVEAINAKSGVSGVQAVLSPEGDIVLTNTAENEGQDITVEPLLASGGNALNITPGTYTARLELQRKLSGTDDTPIELGFGTGKPSDLAALGFRVATYIKGTVPDDVLVFATDSTGSRVNVSATYQGSPVDVAKDLRAHPMAITFVAPDGGSRLRYRITDNATGTVLAERDLDPAALQEGVSYRGLRISFTSEPKVGDVFQLDGNPDGTGNNDNIRKLAALQSARLLTGGKSLAAAYTDQVNEMGNVARQASIAQDALTVVRDQAAENRDKVAGVNLDDEAANLIRFQQAYQASAKVMQIASQLFDSILQVN